MSRLFGTDGIRGIAYKELTEELASNVGRALGYILNRDGNRNKVVIGYDTRESSLALFESIKISLQNMGIDVIDLGVIPTPAVSYLVKNYECNAGVMITASHNPYEYNGIKIFNGEGYKLSDELEDEIEDIIKNAIKIDKSSIKGVELDNYNPLDDYVDYLISCLENDNFSGLKIVIDCANGATYKSASKLFKKLNCDIDIINNMPDGKNVNNNCGSTHIEILQDYVVKKNMDIGIAFDGDGDRCILVDNLGNVVDGDYVLAILSNNLGYKNVVGTVMSNLGLIKYCRSKNINFISTKVGDRYVLEEMLKNNYKLGGEQSGHIIMKDYSNTGDGELTSLKILEIMKKTAKSLFELSSIMKKYPQMLVNIDVDNSRKDEIMTSKDVNDKIDLIKEELGDDYKVLVRASGTEANIRIMIQGIDEKVIENRTKEIADIIRNSI